MKKIKKRELIDIKIAITSAITSDKKQENADFVNKYPDKIQRQKDKYGEN